MVRVNIDRLVKAAVVLILGVAGLNWYQNHQERQRALLGPVGAAVEREIEAQELEGAIDRFVEQNALPDRATAVAKLSRRGIARLSTDQLVERAQILVNLDLRVPSELCAARFLGTMTPDQERDYLAGLDSSAATRLARLLATAIQAELTATSPLPRATPEERQALFQTIHDSFSERDRERFSQVLNTLERAAPIDVCWMSTSMVSTANILPDPPRSQLFQTMAKIEAGL